MKTLVIVRHAKSSWEDPLLKDVDRPLNKRGKKDAVKMAIKLQEYGIVPELIVTSHAKRAHLTAKAFANVFNVDNEDIQIEKSLYHGDIEEFINATYMIDDALDNVILFGHNPGITFFANVICEANIENVPTSGVLIIKSSASSWSDTDISALKLEAFLYPKQED